ncbi:swi5-dependent recombination DNA repair protein 1 homolog [Brachionichthys hirsutus]|uniref:swi5-dependent recombination DNA repair protein 1 homolog n=1 Tax=Brachionichthys hirsutus TaxID=412623 RepID=UPI0036052C91
MEVARKESKSPLDSSPFENKEQRRHQGLSSPLKARLKRSRRSFISPSSVAKRLCVEEEEDAADNPDNPNNPDVDANRDEPGSEDGCVCAAVPEPKSRSPTDSGHRRDRLRKEVKEKTETLRRLELVKMYRSKNDLAQLQTLIDKWRSCAQAALFELQSDVPIDGQKASLSELIDLFGLDGASLHFDRTEEDFTP